MTTQTNETKNIFIVCAKCGKEYRKAEMQGFNTQRKYILFVGEVTLNSYLCLSCSDKYKELKE